MARAFRILAGTACSLMLASAAFGQTPPPTLTLADAVKEALVKNERLVNQADTIAQADLGLRLARKHRQDRRPARPNTLPTHAPLPRSGRV